MAHVVALNPQDLPSGKRALLARLGQVLADYREYRRVYKELNALNDRELADIGISRHNIADIARGAAYGG